MTAALIYNDYAGTGNRARRLKAVREALERAGVSHHLEITRAPRDGTRLAREAASRGAQLVIAAGGDGTVNEVVNGLVGTKATLAILPLGTGNLAAHEFGIPTDPIEAALAIPRNRAIAVDVGKANDRFFLMMVSLGLDAKALRDAPGWAYRFLGWHSFYWTGLFSLFKTSPYPMQVTVDGEERAYSVRLLVISNIKGYGLPGCEFLSGASPTDGRLDLGFLKSQRIRNYLSNFHQLWRQQPLNGRELHQERLSRATVTAPEPVPVQIDGDFYGYTPLEISIVPTGLSILSSSKQGGAS